MSDDDDVSVIALSDDEGATTAKPSQSKPAPQRAVSFVPEASIRGSTAKAKSGSTPSASQRAGNSSGKQGKGHGGRAKAVEPVYEDDEEQDDSGRGGAAGHYDEDDEEEEAGGGGGGSYRQGGGGGGTVLDEQGLDYISNRFASRKDEYDAGPSTWLEVDEAEIREVGGPSALLKPCMGCMPAILHGPRRAYAWVIGHAGPVHGCMGHCLGHARRMHGLSGQGDTLVLGGSCTHMPVPCEHPCMCKCHASTHACACAMRGP